MGSGQPDGCDEPGGSRPPLRFYVQRSRLLGRGVVDNLHQVGRALRGVFGDLQGLLKDHAADFANAAAIRLHRAKRRLRELIGNDAGVAGHIEGERRDHR